MSALLFHTVPIQFVKKLILLLFFSLGLIMMSSYTLKELIKKDSDPIEKSSESEEQEQEQESENERENESEEDDREEDFLRIHLYSAQKSETFRKHIYLHQESESLHIGDTFTPPPDQI